MIKLLTCKYILSFIKRKDSEGGTLITKGAVLNHKGLFPGSENKWSLLVWISKLPVTGDVLTKNFLSIENILKELSQIKDIFR